MSASFDGFTYMSTAFADGYWFHAFLIFTLRCFYYYFQMFDKLGSWSVLKPFNSSSFNFAQRMTKLQQLYFSPIFKASMGPDDKNSSIHVLFVSHNRKFIDYIHLIVQTLFLSFKLWFLKRVGSAKHSLAQIFDLLIFWLFSVKDVSDIMSKIRILWDCFTGSFDTPYHPWSLDKSVTWV